MTQTGRACYPSALLVTIVISGAGTLFLIAQRHAKEDNNAVTKATETSVPAATPSVRRVTKSLEEIRRNGEIPELSDHVVLFNRVPKCGSEMLVLLMQWLQGANGFRHVRLGGGNVRRLTTRQQEKLVEEVTRRVRDEAVPVTFDRHVYFLNFSHFDRQSPTYINLARDPIDKAASRFYYARVTRNPRNPDLRAAPPLKAKQAGTQSFDECVRSGAAQCTYKTGKAYDLSVPYFCGHHEWCMELNNQRALDSAKANVERYFPVVGILEELNVTLAVLENRLPYFFRGLQKIYFQDLMEPHHNSNRRRRQVSRATRKYLEKVLDAEYEFYYWLRARLLQQYSDLMSH